MATNDLTRSREACSIYPAAHFNWLVELKVAVLDFQRQVEILYQWNDFPAIKFQDRQLSVERCQLSQASNYYPVPGSLNNIETLQSWAKVHDKIESNHLKTEVSFEKMLLLTSKYTQN